MALASLFGGFALANAGLGAVHGFAGPLGGMIGAHHGALCATLLPGVTAANIRALRNRASAHPSIDRYAEVARIMSGRPDATADDAPEALRSLCNALRIPSVRQLGLDASQIPDAVAQAKKASSMKGNPIVLTDDELTAVLTEAMQS
jgi:alcohol dehydrogenase class IV